MDFSLFVDAFKSQGFIGVLLLGAFYVIYRFAIRYDSLQEKRIEESLSNYKIMTDLTQAVRDLTAAHKESRKDP